jgi:hypothetical protein
MKVNVIGVASAIIAFASLALPWWTMTISLLETPLSWNMYTWGVRSPTEIVGDSLLFDFADWYRYAALAFIVVGVILGLVGSVTVGRRGWNILATSGISMILAAIIFVAGLATDPALADATPPIGIFESKEVTILEFSYSISTYLHIGFFLAITAAILASISLLRHPAASS